MMSKMIIFVLASIIAFAAAFQLQPSTCLTAPPSYGTDANVGTIEETSQCKRAGFVADIYLNEKLASYREEIKPSQIEEIKAQVQPVPIVIIQNATLDAVPATKRSVKKSTSSTSETSCSALTGVFVAVGLGLCAMKA